jgi:hypothetical protein
MPDHFPAKNKTKKWLPFVLVIIQRTGVPINVLKNPAKRGFESGRLLTETSRKVKKKIPYGVLFFTKYRRFPPARAGESYALKRALMDYIISPVFPLSNHLGARFLSVPPDIPPVIIGWYCLVRIIMVFELIND